MSLNKKFEYSIYIVIALLYSFTLSLIPEVLLRDRDSYLVYATDADRIFEQFLNEGIGSVIFNEPLFLGLNYILDAFIEPAIIPSLFSFFTSFVLVCFLLKEIEGWWLKFMAVLCITFIPFLFHLQLVILRQGLALSIFIIVIMISKKEKNWVIASFMLAFIHSSFFIVCALMCLLYWVKNMKYSSQIIVFIGFSLLLSFSLFFVGNMIGARQVEIYQSDSSSGSGLSFLLYLILLCLLLTRGEVFLKSYPYSSIAILGLICYLTLYFTSPIAGRLIATFMPFIICLLFHTSKSISYVFICIYLLLNLVIFKDAVMNNSFTEYFTSFANVLIF